MISGIVPDSEKKLKKVLKLISDDITAKDFILKMLNVHPENRPTIEEVKKHKFFEGLSWTKVKDHMYQPFYIPKLDGPFDTQYFENTN